MMNTRSLPSLPPVHPLAHGVALTALALLTIGFAIYQVLLITSVIPAYLGGYLAVVSVSLLGPVFLAYVLQIASQSWRFNMGDLLFFLFIAMIALFALYNWIGGGRVVIAESHLAIIPQMIVFFAIYHLMDLESRAAKLLHWAVLGALSIIMLTLSLGDVDPTNYNEVVLVKNDDVASYMHYALAYLFIFVGCIAIAPSLAVRLLLYVLGIITLFYNGARSELIVAVPICLLAESLISRRNMVLFLVLSVIFLFFARPFLDLLVEVFPNNRAVGLVLDFSADQSLQEREFVFENALEVIRKHPIFGDYGYYAEGLYAHNMLSAWADFGLFGMALFLLGLLFPIGGAVENFLKNRLDPELLAAALFAVASAALFGFAKAYIHPIFGVALALYSRQVARKYLSRHDPRHFGVATTTASAVP